MKSAPNGVRISIDDFGTGFSSLAHLHRLPVDTIKIDRVFISNMMGLDDDAALVNAIIGIAATVRKHVIAEGVETEAQRHRLLHFGCHEGQGYLFSALLVPRTLRVWLSTKAVQRLVRNRIAKQASSPRAAAYRIQDIASDRPNRTRLWAKLRICSKRRGLQSRGHHEFCLKLRDKRLGEYQPATRDRVSGLSPEQLRIRRMRRVDEGATPPSLQGARRSGQFCKLERVKGIEPSYSAWKAAALPLSYTRDLNDFRLRGLTSRPDWNAAC